MKEQPRLIIFVCLVCLVVLVFASFIFPPTNFPSGKVIEIPDGVDVDQIAQILYQNRVIRFPAIFETLVSRESAAKNLKAGFYQFEKPLFAGEIIKRLETGLFSTEKVRLVVPEGLNVEQLANLVAKNLPGINQATFIQQAKQFPGRLFPATYVLPSQTTSYQLIKMMRDNFDNQISPLADDIKKSGRSLDDVINMAALVEEEASDSQTRQIIAGILWKRLDKGMKLEVDVATSTYQTAGLPPEPIVSPGLDSIKATLSPEETPYWFFLSDKSGTAHYAKTYDEHKFNIDKYLVKR